MKQIIAAVLVMAAWPAKGEYFGSQEFLQLPDAAKEIYVLGAVDAILATLPQVDARMHGAVAKCLTDRPFSELMTTVNKHFKYVKEWYGPSDSAVIIIWGAVDDLCLDDAQY